MKGMKHVKRIAIALLLAALAATAACALGSAPGADSGGKVKPITGAFFQIDGTIMALSDAQMLAELGAMKAVGMDKVIIQYTRYDGEYYFPVDGRAAATPFPDESFVDMPWKGSAKYRYLKITIQRDPGIEWIISPEIEIMSGGKNIAAESKYKKVPIPVEQYSDEGRKLVDGKFSRSWADQVGWQFKDRIEISFEFKAPRDIDSINVKFLQSKLSGVQPPTKGYALSFSSDGKIWEPAIEVAPQAASLGGTVKDTVGTIMGAADALGMKVYLGLGLDSSYWDGALDIQKHLAENTALLDRLWSVFGSRPSFAGWYLPEELDDRNFLTPAKTEMVRSYIDSIVGHAKSLTPADILMSPYYGMEPDGKAYAKFWDKVFSGNHPDVVAMQDGVGCTRNTTKEAAGVLRDLAEVMRKRGVRLWVNVETFQQTHGWPVDEDDWDAVPGAFERIRSQIEAETPFAEDAVIFDFPSYVSPRIAEGSYAGYAKYWKEKFNSR